MKISTVINSYNRNRSPYTRRGLVNHLPMGQLALYQMTGDLEKVDMYSQEYIDKIEIPELDQDFRRVNSIEECLGERDLYASCIKLLDKKIEKEDIEDLVKDILNTYPLGMSSGLFHTLIKLGYAVEGYKLDKDLKEELIRALSYYITGYREADLFTKKVTKENFILKVEELQKNRHINLILNENETLGTKMRALYDDEFYMREGAIIDGDEIRKIRTLLKLLVRGFDNSGNIILLHCINSIHALYMLKDYFNDFSTAIDILTTTIVTHLLTLDRLSLEDKLGEITEQSWHCIRSKASESENIHAIKLAYSASILDGVYDVPELKETALKRIRGN